MTDTQDDAIARTADELGLCTCVVRRVAEDRPPTTQAMIEIAGPYWQAVVEVASNGITVQPLDVHQLRAAIWCTRLACDVVILQRLLEHGYDPRQRQAQAAED